ncbi:hypothetical protein ES703_122539 [subsurface metagenome]
MTQWQAASTQPPHLKAIFPFSAAMDFFGRRGGALDLAIVIGWILRLAGPNAIIGSSLEKYGIFLSARRAVNVGTQHSTVSHGGRHIVFYNNIVDGLCHFVSSWDK